jgi:APA family basic amino acid/polyamine antiporter
MKREQMATASKLEHVPLRRVLNLREAVALGIGGTIGGGIFVLVGTAIGQAGPGAVLSFALAFLASLLIALPYAELACRYPLAGGGYAFARAVLGRHWGFLMGWDYWGAYLYISGYVTLGFGSYLHSLVGIPPLFGALGLITCCTIINLLGVKLSGRVQSLIVLLALVSLVGFGLFGLPHLTMRYYTPLLPNGMGGVISAALLAFLAFGGFDMVAAAGEEIERPERTLPLAILLTLGGVLGIYLLVTFVTAGMLPWRTVGAAPAPLAETAAALLGPAGRQFMAIAALLTTAATGNAVLVVTSRISFAMARDGLLPPQLARVQPRTNVPWLAIVLNGILLALIALTGSIALAAAIGGFLYVLHFVFPLVVLVRLRAQGHSSPAFRTPFPFLVLPLAFAGCVLLLVASGWIGMSIGLAWLTAGLCAYLTARFFQRRGTVRVKSQQNPDGNAPPARSIPGDN